VGTISAFALGPRETKKGKGKKNHHLDDISYEVKRALILILKQRYMVNWPENVLL
jgi:hypothetical protein